MSADIRQIKYSPGEAPSTEKPIKRKKGTNREPTYGCLKGGTKPTYRNMTMRAPTAVAAEKPVSRPGGKTLKHYSSFGRSRQGNTIRVHIKDQKTVNAVEREKKKLDKQPLSVVCDYLAKRNLYQAGSDAPEDILRETYKNAHLAGNVYNNNDEIMMKNFLKGAVSVS
jgi:hypothetical protein